jgi:hypothetical protein
VPTFTGLTDRQDAILFAFVDARRTGRLPVDSFHVIGTQRPEGAVLAVIHDNEQLYVPGTLGELHAIGAPGYLLVQQFQSDLPLQRRSASWRVTITDLGTRYVRWRRLPAWQRALEGLRPEGGDLRRVLYSAPIAAVLVKLGEWGWDVARPILMELVRRLGGP